VPDHLQHRRSSNPDSLAAVADALVAEAQAVWEEEAELELRPFFLKMNHLFNFKNKLTKTRKGFNKI
jgi:hypothetical protein